MGIKKQIKKEYQQRKKAENLRTEIEIRQKKRVLRNLKAQQDLRENSAQAALYHGQLEKYFQISDEQEQADLEILEAKAGLHDAKADHASRLAALKAERKRKLEQ